MSHKKTGGLKKHFMLKKDSRVTVTSNFGIEHSLINRQMGVVIHFACFNPQKLKLMKHWMIKRQKKDARNNDFYVKRNEVTPIVITEADFLVSMCSHMIRCKRV